MNSPGDLPWSQPEQQFAPMAPSGEGEFSSLLDLDLDINFPNFDSNGDSAQNHESAEPGHNRHTQQHQFQPNPAAVEDAYGQQQFAQMHQGQQSLANSMGHSQHMQNMSEMHSTNNGYNPMNIHAPYSHQHPQFHDAQGMPFPLQQQPQPHHHHVVPPTPNSMDLAGDTEKYLARMDPQTRSALEQRYQLRNDDPMSFTPLVSPAVTPHETNFQIPPGFTVPGAYFSPLTSPMLEAQRNSQRAVTSNPRKTASPAATSPVDPDVDMLDGSTEEPAKKLRKKISNPGPRSVANAARVRQSPISKAQRKRGAMSNVIPTKEASSILSDPQRPNTMPNRPASATGLTLGRTHDSSEAESISPEPLSESIMRPPPKPNSKTQSPAILPQNQSGQSSLSNNYLGSPATPASLMRIQQQQAQDQQQQQLNGAGGSGVPMDSTSDASGLGQQISQAQSPLEDLALPEAANNTRPQLHNLVTSTATGEDQATPRVSARETATSGSAIAGTPSTLSAGAPTKPSPRSSAIRSPTGPPGSSGSSGKAEGRGGRSNKKRNSTGSALVSPALRPKISPSIKPLLPEGVNVTDEHHALLLASKSNYQNLIDGTRLPGVNYPQELSTNLTSKRTSHKIAEQGRRNRINTALQEMQSLLPPPPPTSPNNVGPKDHPASKDERSSRSPAAAAAAAAADGGAESGSGSGKTTTTTAQASAQSNSKAATVESAIEYIKQLKREAEARVQEIEELKQRLGRTTSSPGSEGAGNASTKVA